MYGSTLRRSMHGIVYMAKSPKNAVRWVNGRIQKKSPMDLRLPWIAWDCIDELSSSRLWPGMRVFEWGAGGSTLFFLERECEVVTIESSPAWTDAIVRAVENLGGSASERWELRTFDIAGSREQGQAFIDTVAQGHPWDLVLVDGFLTEWPSRLSCLKRAREHVKPGGMLVLDDAWRNEFLEVPELLLPGWKRERFRSLGPCRLGVTQTDIYTKPSPDPQ